MKLKKAQLIQEEFYQSTSRWVWKSYWTDPETYDFYLSLAGSLKEKEILEAGCGDGRFTNELVKTGSKIYGCDYSERALEIAKVMNPKAVFFKCDLVKDDLGVEKYDVIFFIEVIEHIQPIHANTVLKKLHSALKKKGIIIITTPNNLQHVSSHHFIHYGPEELKHLVSKYFIVQSTKGRITTNLFLRVINKILSNNIFELKHLSKLFQRKLYLNCPFEKARQLVIVGKK